MLDNDPITEVNNLTIFLITRVILEIVSSLGNIEDGEIGKARVYAFH
jgi:hypothetical protein